MRSTMIAAAVAALAGSAAFAADHTVYFAFDRANIDAEAQATIDAAIADYKANGDTAVSIVGHTDTSGSLQYNMGLSERRANAVAAALEAQGVPASVITTAWRGESEPAVATGDGVRERLNRRAEVGMGSFEPAPEAAPMMVGPFRVGFGPYVGYNMQQNDKSWLAGVNLTASYDVHKYVTLEAEQAVFYNFAANDNGIGGRTAGGVNFNFGDLGGVVPYVGANAGVSYVDGSFDDGFFYGPEIGLEVFGVHAKVAYDIYPERDADEGVISATIGYGLRF